MDFFNNDELPGSESLKLAFNSNVWILWTVRIILVIYASFIAPNLNKDVSMFFNNMFVRLIFAVLIIYLCYVDPTSAILLAVSFVVSVQTLNKHKINNMNNNANSRDENYVTGDGIDTYNSSEEEEAKKESVSMNEGFYSNSDSHSDSHSGSGSGSGSGSNNDLENKYLQNNDREDEIVDSFSNRNLQNQDSTMSDPLMNSLEKEVKESPQMVDNVFTNSSQLLSAQENTIQNANQNDSVQTFKNQFSAQGSNYPSGYNLNNDCMNNAASF